MNRRAYRGGALSPLEYYMSEVEPLYNKLENTIGTANYIINWKKLAPQIETKRKAYVSFSPPTSIGTAFLKVALDFYKENGYETEDVEGSKIDDEFNIDIIAEKNDAIIVTQVKAGEISRQEVKKFLEKAPNFIINKFGTKKRKELDIVYLTLGSSAANTFLQFSKRLITDGFAPNTIPLETVCERVPRYRRLFKEWKKLHE